MERQIIIAGLILVLIMGLRASQPRGIRNNNPGNIRRSADQWQGLSAIQTDAAFFQFSDPVWGIRALARVVYNYQSRHGLSTVRGIISRWAPTSENNTAAYIQSVAGRLGVHPDQPLDVVEVMPELVKAIIYHENGQQPYNDLEISVGIKRALA